MYGIHTVPGTVPGRRILNSIGPGTESQGAPLLKHVRDQLDDSQKLLASPWPWTPLWMKAVIPCGDNVPGIKMRVSVCMRVCVLKVF